MTRFCTLFTIVVSIAASVSAGSRLNREEGARSHWTRLSGAGSDACAITDDGRASCWGRNIEGQVGATSGGFAVRSPVVVANLPTVVSIAAGFEHTCALTFQSAVQCWGRNIEGELGNNNRVASSPTPSPVSGLGDVVGIAVGTDFSCALKVDGTVWCWGDNSFGELGAGIDSHTLPTTSTPTQVANLLRVRALAAGSRHACALLANGSVQCCGNNLLGQLGIGASDTLNHITPAAVMPFVATSGVVAVDISAGIDTTCARLSDGSVNCWGDNENGELGNGALGQGLISASPVATNISPLVVALSTGGQHTCAILADGSVSCWGRNRRGELGDGGTTDNPNPGPAVPNVANAVEISSGSQFTCARQVDGTIRCWGENGLGEHGNGTVSPSGTDSVSGISGTISAGGVAAGSEFTCARRGTGAPACWGKNDVGQLGNSGSPNNSPNAVAVTGITNAIGVTAGDKHACELDSTGIAKCWGNNSNGQLGNGTSGGISNQPVPVTSPFFPFIALSAGFNHTCGVTVGGLIRCWGDNSSGQLGTGDLNPSSVSVQAAVILNAVAVAAGQNFTCALVADGTVSCWGDNSARQIGDNGAEAIQKTPKQVAGLSNIVGIAAGKKHACAVSVTGTVSCWGDNSRGQIGNNSTQTAGTPVLAQGLTVAVGISAGTLFTCATTTFGGAECWGSNSAGELAAADNLDHLRPTGVIGSFKTINGVTFAFRLSGIAAIATGTGFSGNTDLQHACTLQTFGAIDCWGANGAGEIGDGTTTDRPRPTTVNSFTANVDPAVSLENNGRIAIITALINCPAGAEAHLTLTVTQGGIDGAGRSVVQCEDRLLRHPMTIPARGPDGFHAGAAVATVEALVLDSGQVLDDQHWTRVVTLTGP